MKRLRRYIQKLLERALDRTRDGPKPPRRLADEVRLFRVMHRDATVEQWEIFARTMAANSYRDGFSRGYAAGATDADPNAVDPRYEQAPSDDPTTARMMQALRANGDPLADTTPQQRSEFYKLMSDLDKRGIPFQILPDRVVRRG